MRRKKHEQHENHERWLVSYADFITLLFAFFVVLYATSSQNQEKEKRFEQSIRENLKLFGAYGSEPKSAGGIFGNVIEPINIFAKRGVGNEELRDYVKRLVDQNLTAGDKKDIIADIKHDRMGVRIRLSASELFPVASSKARLPALKKLDKLVNILKMSERQILIEGHTDNQPVLGGIIDSNWELSSLRAATIVRYLETVHKFDGDKLAAMAYADQRPIASNKTEKGRAQNRRIEIVIVNNDNVQF